MFCGLVEAQDDLTPEDLIAQARVKIASHSEHVALLQAAIEKIQQQSDPDYGLMGDVFIELSMSQINAGELAEARELVQRGLGLIGQNQYPNQFLRLSAIPPILELVEGRTQKAIDGFQSLLVADHSAADPVSLDRVRFSYATALYENGQVVVAQQILQDVLTRALQRGDEASAIRIGNNLVVLLIYQGLYEDARDWMKRLDDARRKTNFPFLIYSLRLHEIELRGLLGDRQGAIKDFRDFISEIDEDTPDTIAGNAYEYLADALFAVGDLEGSKQAGMTALDILSELAFELTEARLTLIRTLLALGQYDEAEVILNEAEMAVLNAPRQARVSALRLELIVRRSGSQRGVEELQKLVLATQQDIRSNAVQSLSYYDTRLTAARQASEIARMREAEAVLSAQAEASEARASALLASEQAVRKNRNLLLAIVVLAALALVAILYALNRRQYQQRVLANQQALNRELSLQVEEKSEALVRQLNEQAEMQRALDRKKQTEAIGQLTGNVAHDFNNLLQVISSANEQLLVAARTPAQRSSLIASMDSVKYASDMTYQLLAYSRQQELKATATNVSELLRGTQMLFRSAVGEEIELTFSESEHDAVALVDPAKLTTAVLNLLRNAADAMDDGGQIQLSIHNEQLNQQDCSQWRALTPGQYVMIRVTDNGHGMDEATLEKACEPFFTTKEEASGTGLGLSSVYGFVRQSEGDLKLISEPYKETSVTIALPASQEQIVEHAPRSNDKGATLKGKRVLVVEDNEMVARTVTLALCSADAEVHCLASADEAIEHLSDGHAYDYLLTDVRMPGANDGYDLARWVAAQSLPTPVIIMSGYTDRTDTSQDFPVINKPFTRAELITCLQNSHRQVSLH